MSYMFNGCKTLTGLLGTKKWDTSNVTTMGYMFADCSKLQKLNISTWDTHSVSGITTRWWDDPKGFFSMFEKCNSLGGIEMTINTAEKEVDMQNMFSLSNINLGIKYAEDDATTDGSGNKTSKVIIHGDLSGVKSTKKMFQYNDNIKDIVFDQRNMGVDKDSTTYSKYTNDKQAFANCTDMSYMFINCDQMSSFDWSNWNASKVEDMSYMFSQCDLLTSFDFTGLNTSSVKNFAYIFDSDLNLASITFPPDFNTTSVTSYQGMFYNCGSLVKIDISTFKTTNSPDIRQMFHMDDRDTVLKKLETIYVDPTQWNGNLNSTDEVFRACTKLAGGVAWNGNNTGAMAKVNGGYFTDVANKP